MKAQAAHRGLGQTAVTAFLALSALALLGALAALVPATASAQAKQELFWQAPGDGVKGEGAGRLSTPGAVGASPLSGSLYVADRRNYRVGEFTAWGEFVKAWGWGVLDGSAELQVCTRDTGCGAGLEGTGAGQQGDPTGGIAVDSAGDVYVGDFFTISGGNLRIQKFSSEGEFLWMVGGEVNKTTGEDICTKTDFEGGDECGAGVSGTGPREFSTGEFRNFIATGPDDTLYVGDQGRVQELNPDGSFKGQIGFEGELASLEGQTVGSLDVDPNSGDLYLATSAEEDVFRVSPAGALVDVLEDEALELPTAIAVDSAGNAYVTNSGGGLPGDGETEVLKFSPEGECLICGEGFLAPPPKPFAERIRFFGLASSDACGIEPIDDLYGTYYDFGEFSYLRAYGPIPDPELCPPPKRAPEIASQYATSVSASTATLRAEINPRFWAGGGSLGDTTYYLQYATAACIETGGWEAACVVEQPGPPGAILDTEPIDAPVATEPIPLSGLEPGTSYRYRFVASSEGGGPVFGEGGSEGEDGAAGTFLTYPLPSSAPDPCPNAALREESGRRLPDCRAYEMVSPVEKAGGEIAVRENALEYPAELTQSSASGNGLAYSSERAFAGAASAPYTSQYIARRGGGGWSTEPISPPRGTPSVTGNTAAQFDVQYKAFSAGLGSGWLLHDTDPALDPCAPEGFLNLYKRTAAGDYQALTTAEPPVALPKEYWPEVQGSSADGTRTVFRANDRLTADASTAKAAGVPIYQVYEHIDGPGCGELRLVSVLPGGKASNTQSSVGTPNSFFAEGRVNAVAGAVSADGSLVFWTASAGEAASGAGTLYVRIDGTETVQIAPSPARFWGAATDSSVAIYTREGALHLYDVEAEEDTMIATGTLGVVGASEDASRIYFASTEAIAGSGENSEGDFAQVGQPNLYLYEEGGEGEASTSFVGTLSGDDVNPLQRLAPLANEPARRTARTSPDGSHLAFSSTAPLTGYDNNDRATGEPAAEVYRYAAATGELACVSCDPSGARPVARTFPGSAAGVALEVAALLPPWQSQLHAPRALAEDGARVYFESYGPLVLQDTNGKADVYQWEALGKGDCDAADVGFQEQSGGCLSLISSGKSPTDSQFVDADPDAGNVFFTTGASLVPADPGLIDIYDARAGGGFAAPEAGPAPCEAGSCRPDSPAPPAPTPASAAFAGVGNLAADAPAPRCGRQARRARRLSGRAKQSARAARRARAPRRAKAMRRRAHRLAGKAKRASRGAKRCRARRAR